MRRKIFQHTIFAGNSLLRVTVISFLIFLPGLIALAERLTNVRAQNERTISNLWQDVDEKSIPASVDRKTLPNEYRTVRLDLSALTQLLLTAPKEFTAEARDTPAMITLPMSNGKQERFAIVESSILEPDFAALQPETKTYSGRGIDDPTATTRLGVTLIGFHAIVISAKGTTYILPYAKGETEHYISYDNHAYPQADNFRCGVVGSQTKPDDQAQIAPKFSTGGSEHFYRMAVAATGEFTDENGGTVGSAQAAITTRINMVTAIYQREVGIRLTLINNTSIIYTDKDNDPYTGGNINTLIVENQSNVDSKIGDCCYDISQVFDASLPSGGGQGLASLGSVCVSGRKGKGTSGGSGNNFVDLTAHEIGHQFNATHTFNDNLFGSCGSFNGANQRDASTAVEPGSGSTIMSYGGTCDISNLQSTRDTYFQFISLGQIGSYIAEGGPGSNCDQEIVLTNHPPHITSPDDGETYVVPKRTPFYLNMTATDADFEVLTYCWEEWDIGDPSPPNDDDGHRPIFRSYPPVVSSGIRYFPSIQYVLNNQNLPPATYFGGSLCPNNICQTGEVMPTTDRFLGFQGVVRDGHGVSTVSVAVEVDADSGPFRITVPNLPLQWTQDTRKNITWEVAHTNVSPVACANVKISLSTDSGMTFPLVLAASTENDGDAVITVPHLVNTLTVISTCRIKVEGTGVSRAIFFDISDADFTIKPFLGVTTTSDNGADGDPTPGSLREAILDVNSMERLFGGAIAIPFNIPGDGVKTINLFLPLPPVDAPTVVDGWSQGPEGYQGPPLIEINGSGVGLNPDNSQPSGLIISGSFCIVRGLVIRNFLGSGIRIRNLGGFNQGFVDVQGCYLGTAATGSTAAGNGIGIFIDDTPNCNIGGTTPSTRNVISGNIVGVMISGSNAAANEVFGNYIGTNSAGTARVPNANDGVRILNAPGNTIGGTVSGFGNVISGNGVTFNTIGVSTFADGIEINGLSASGNTIQGNMIGANPAGTGGLDNTANCILIVDAPNTVIGGTTAAARNIIADSGVLSAFGADGIEIFGTNANGTVIQGNYIGTDATGSINLGHRGSGILITNAPGTVIGGGSAAARNIICGAKNAGGINIAGSIATGTIIQGNYIGTNAAGTAAIGNNAAGIWIETANNTIGGNVAGARNLISGNVNGHGILLKENGATGNIIQGNYIGTDVTGTAAVGNVVNGIEIVRAGNNQIGGTSAAARNIISGNGSNGIHLSDLNAPGAVNIVQGNYIGTDVTGNAAVGNGVGVRLDDVSNNTIGGTAVGAGNVISGNNRLGLGGSHGVMIFSNVPVTGTKLEGNVIGTNAAGTGALGNFSDGIRISLTGNCSVTIGGASPGARNIISANALSGISFNGSVLTVKGNYLGTDVTGTNNLGNSRSGIEIVGGNNNIIGGAGPGDGNVIAFNGAPGSGFFFAGVQVFSTGNIIRGNSFFGNTGLGIDLSQGGGGVTGNDNCDIDNGPNGLQNYPVLTSAGSSGSTVTVSGILNSTANTIFAIDVYASTDCDPSGNGEGQTYLGSAMVITNASCSAVFNISVAASIPLGRLITATAIDPANNTSEFSTCVAAGCGYSLSPDVGFFSKSGGSGTANVFAGSAACNWQANTGSDWITITSPTSGSGNGNLAFTVAANPIASARQGSISLGGQSLSIVQDGGIAGDCSYVVQPAFLSHPATGGTGTFVVKSDQRCAWQAVSNVAWVTVTSGKVGLGSGAINYSVQPNPGVPGRIGTINVGGQLFSVKQKGAG